jgi:hypothetical protein
MMLIGEEDSPRFRREIPATPTQWGKDIPQGRRDCVEYGSEGLNSWSPHMLMTLLCRACGRLVSIAYLGAVIDFSRVTEELPAASARGAVPSGFTRGRDVNDSAPFGCNPVAQLRRGRVRGKFDHGLSQHGWRQWPVQALLFDDDAVGHAQAARENSSPPPGPWRSPWSRWGAGSEPKPQGGFRSARKIWCPLARATVGQAAAGCLSSAVGP